MRRLPDAGAAAVRHDDQMQEREPGAGWADHVQRLILHGRDREAAELAAHHLQDASTAGRTPGRVHRSECLTATESLEQEH